MDVLTKATIRELVLSENVRIDGRDTTTIRPISVEVGVLPRTHGSGLFTRGQTQALSIATLGPASDEQRLDTISPETEKRYMHHYNFPPYSVGEARPMRGPGRREIGHGALAERALLPVLPTVDEFPYTIRVVSEVVSSNGSTSMASGLRLDPGADGRRRADQGAGRRRGDGPDHRRRHGRYAVLTDISGKEDAYGDMDFKVAGTADGVTALQMDIKVRRHHQRDPARRAGAGTRGAAVHPRQDDRGHRAGRTRAVAIRAAHHDHQDPGRQDPRRHRRGRQDDPPDHRGDRHADQRRGRRAPSRSPPPTSRPRRRRSRWIEGLTKDVEVGKEYLGKVTRIMNFGAFVEILPGKEGLVHISQLADYRVARVEDVVSIGDELMVVVTEIDRMGRVNLSRRAAMERHMAKAAAGSASGNGDNS